MAPVHTVEIANRERTAAARFGEFSNAADNNHLSHSLAQGKEIIIIPVLPTRRRRASGSRGTCLQPVAIEQWRPTSLRISFAVAVS
jgi:hypothetical protein